MRSLPKRSGKCEWSKYASILEMTSLKFKPLLTHNEGQMLTNLDLSSVTKHLSSDLDRLEMLS